jgi:hypothetical protein
MGTAQATMPIEGLTLTNPPNLGPDTEPLESSSIAAAAKIPLTASSCSGHYHKVEQDYHKVEEDAAGLTFT